MGASPEVREATDEDCGAIIRQAAPPPAREGMDCRLAQGDTNDCRKIRTQPRSAGEGFRRRSQRSRLAAQAGGEGNVRQGNGSACTSRDEAARRQTEASE